jgi:hypothetical protein
MLSAFLEFDQSMCKRRKDAKLRKAGNLSAFASLWHKAKSKTKK